MNNLTEITMTPAAAPGSAPGVERTSHVLSAVYPGRSEAEGVRQLLEAHGISATEMRIFHETPPQPGDVLSDDVLKDVL
ncbi:MAG TPA: hypothetical protein PLV36_19520, partial [Zoogloea sp.]|nr:hypothetical protein [Zoogloea sp.]